MKFIPYGRQDINKNDIDKVLEVLEDDYITQGPRVPLFEKAISNYCNVNHGVAVNSATSALHLSCIALGLSKGDYLWTSPNTFVASANCALYCGANIDFVDIDPQTYNMSAAALKIKLQQAEKENKLPKIVIPVHFAGQSCEMEKISKLSREYGFYIIEDASHAIGGRYQDQPIGGCTFSDITVFSFHPVKIITSAEGGIILTNNNSLFKKILLLRNHGITRDPHCMTSSNKAPWYYEQVELGYNFRMNDLEAALGLSQMQRIDEFVSKRHDLAKSYNEMLRELPIILPWQHPETYSAWHLYVIRLSETNKANVRNIIFNQMIEAGIGVNVHYIPVHTQPYYKKLGFSHGQFPEAEKYYTECLTLPLFPKMTEEEQERVIHTLKNSLVN